MLKKVIFATALALGFVTSFHFGKGKMLPKAVELTASAGACCTPMDPGCCLVGCCGD
jgi:hypothetical protein